MSRGELPGRGHGVLAVLSIDHKSGVVKLETKPHELELHFPPDLLTPKKGDKITVHLSFKKD